MVSNKAFYPITEIQNGRDTTDKIVLNTIERAINVLCRPYLSANAKGVMASGIAASIIELANCEGANPKNFTPK